jgi:diaminopimelate decarboxylase
MSANNQTSTDWAIADFLAVENGQLSINGIRAVELAGKYETPLFVFSEPRIRHNINRLKRASEFIDCPLKICYAAKANSNMGILKAVKEAGSDLEVNSGGELFKALKIGFAPEQIIFNGTSKTIEELEQAISVGIYAIQADSIYEIELIEQVSRRLNKRANVSLRIVPEIKTDTLHGLQTALLTSKFGMMQAEVFEAFSRWHDSEYLDLCGIHLHLGSQNPAPEPYVEAFETLFRNLLKIYNETGKKLSHINLGGGFPVNYLRDTSQVRNFSQAQINYFSASLEPAEVLQAAWQVVKKTAENANAGQLLENITLLLEPGRSVIADAGIILTTVRNRKERPIKLSLDTLFAPADKDVWLLTDAGYNIMLSMETYKWYYHLICASRAAETHETPYKLAGPLCDGGDVYFDIEGENRLPDYRLLPEDVKPNEILALLNVGAYSLAQMFPYNGRPLPAVVLVKENGAVELVRKRDTYEDLLNNDIW